MLVKTLSRHPLRKPRQKIPDSLIYEELDGQPVYYKGYQEVLSGQKTIEEIMGASVIQTFIHSLVFRYFNLIFPVNKYVIGANETGLHLEKKSNLSNDIAVFELEKYLQKGLTTHYADFPPLLIIEVDIKGEMADFGNEVNYYTKKANKLLNFGVSQLVWVFTDTKKILVAEPNQRWILTDWDDEIQLLGQYPFSLAKLLAEVGLNWKTIGEIPKE